MKLRLDSETQKKIKIVKKAQKAFKKLSKRNDLLIQQKRSLKESMAKGLRLCPTKAETVLKQFIGPLCFRHNEVVLGYIPDFSHSYLKIAIEVDGSVHLREDVKRKDAHKDAAFEKNGWILLRFSNSSVLDHINMVVDEIKGVMKNRERGVM